MKSNKLLVASGIPQGSVLKSILLKVSVNDLSSGTEWDLSKVLDKTKLMVGALNKVEVRAAIQRELKGLEIRI